MEKRIKRPKKNKHGGWEKEFINTDKVLIERFMNFLIEQSVILNKNGEISNYQILANRAKDLYKKLYPKLSWKKYWKLKTNVTSNVRFKFFCKNKTCLAKVEQAGYCDIHMKGSEWC